MKIRLKIFKSKKWIYLLTIDVEYTIGIISAVAEKFKITIATVNNL